MIFPASLKKDVYKVFHKFAYNPLMSSVYSNFTNRFGKHSNIPNNARVLWVGIQYVVKAELIDNWNNTFFKVNKADAVKQYSRVVNSILGKEIDVKHIEALHDLGYLPIEVKAIPEGLLVPYGVPCMTVESTVDGFGWVTNMLETMMSAELWGISTSATTAFAYRSRFEQCKLLDKEMIKFMGHDFSYRGMFGTQAAAMSGFGHLCSFYGSDTIPAGLFAEKYYNASFDKELVMASVDATEHSVMCSYLQAGEKESLEHLMTKVTPTGILSVVSDTWDFWKLVTEYLPELKDKILERDGKLVIRPDSGDPVEILCGTGGTPLDNGLYRVFNGDPSDPKTTHRDVAEAEAKGLIECLWDTFGGTHVYQDTNLAGLPAKVMYKKLNDKIGAIYGDSITLERQDEIIKRLVDKGFVPDVVLGIGSYTYQYVTRDTHGSAVKATSMGLTTGEQQAIQKSPKTDTSKKSAAGLMYVGLDMKLETDVSREREQDPSNMLQPLFKDGKLLRETSLAEIRDSVDSYF